MDNPTKQWVDRLAKKLGYEVVWSPVNQAFFITEKPIRLPHAAWSGPIRSEPKVMAVKHDLVDVANWLEDKRSEAVG